MFRPSVFGVLLTAVLVSQMLISTLSAQSIWTNPQHGDSYLAVEVLRPEFEGEDNVHSLSTAWFITGKFQIFERARLVAEIPLAYAKFDDSFSNDSEFAIAAPYIGFEISRQGSSTFAEIGARLPTAPDDKFNALSLGLYADVDRFEAFLPDVLTIVGRINHFSTNSASLGLRVRVGPTVLINTEGGGGDDAEFLLDYGGQIGHFGNHLMLMAGVTGRLILSQDGNFGEKSFHQLGGSLILILGNLQPGIHIRLPLDEDLKDSLDFIAGLQLGIAL